MSAVSSPNPQVARLTFQTKSAFFYSQFWNENGQNVKCARSFIPHSHSGMDRTPFHPFCSREQNERNVANENQRWRTAGRVLSIQTRPYRTYRRKNLDILLGKMKLYFLSHYTKSTRRISVIFPTRKRQFGKWLPTTWRKVATLRRQQTARTGRSALLLRFESAKTTTTRVGEAPIFVTQCLLLADLLRNVYSCQDRASRRAFFYAGNSNYSENSVPTIFIPE